MVAPRERGIKEERSMGDVWMILLTLVSFAAFALWIPGIEWILRGEGGNGE
ncbi:MAG: hypothetical protein BLITH_0014 [Brockia lithotrophica]|uniref:Uncharacterized protein n=1 Tax=Brockia lithotrophica TaxID=933949 RepID=A0A2T5G4U2_9BACL|nr:MAG: hypothetical protein BLITH_0014 [Brockia lithotrophica]